MSGGPARLKAEYIEYIIYIAISDALKCLENTGII